MQLNLSTDYAVRIILLLADKNQMISSTDIADRLCIPQNYLMKVLKRLKNAGLIESQRGTNGGYYLIRPAEEIMFSDIFAAMGDEVQLNRCLEPDHYCSRNATESCPVRAFYQEVQALLDEKFEQTSILSLAKATSVSKAQ